MQAWLAGVLALVIKFLGQDLWAWLKTQWALIVRQFKQTAAAKKVDANQGKPRDDKTRADEANDINS